MSNRIYITIAVIVIGLAVVALISGFNEAKQICKDYQYKTTMVDRAMMCVDNNGRIYSPRYLKNNERVK